MPRCSSGAMGIQACGSQGQCPQNTNCQAGVCCTNQMPTCPITGALASSLCGAQGPQGPQGRSAGCPGGQYCSNVGGCCPMPQCPNNNQGGLQIAIQTCSQSNPQCPPNFSCQNNGCCPNFNGGSQFSLGIQPGYPGYGGGGQQPFRPFPSGSGGFPGMKFLACNEIFAIFCTHFHSISFNSYSTFIRFHSTFIQFLFNFSGSVK